MKPATRVGCLPIMPLGSYVRAFVPAAIVGGWAGLLWHWYVVELGLTVGAWRSGGGFDVITTCAIALGAVLVTFAIVHEPAPRIAAARVAQRRVGVRALALLGTLTVLASLDRVVARPAPDSDPEMADDPAMYSMLDVMPDIVWCIAGVVTPCYFDHSLWLSTR